MNSLSLPIPQQLQRLAGLLGVPGFIGLLLCAAAGLTWLLWLPEVRFEIEQQQEQIEHLRSQLKAATAAQEAAQASDAVASPHAFSKVAKPAALHVPTAVPLVPPAEQVRTGWQQLWAALPTKEQADRQQVDVLEAARVRGVQTLSVQFKGEALKGLPVVWRQQISLPIEAPYPALRAWLAHVQAQPSLSIDAIDVSRADVMSDQVKARVLLSLWRRSTVAEMQQAQQGPQP